MGCARCICCRCSSHKPLVSYIFFLSSEFPSLLSVTIFLFLLQLALRAAPSYQSFAAALVSREGDELKSGFISGMHRDLGVYLPAMQKQLAILDALYEEYNLESDEVVWNLTQRDDRCSWKDKKEKRKMKGQSSGKLLKEGARCILCTK